MRVEDLAAEQGVPAHYLAQILIELKAQGIAKSVRGKEGGYLLARPPGEITLGDVLRAVQGEVFDTPALSDPDCPAELRRAWKRLSGDRFRRGSLHLRQRSCRRKALLVSAPDSRYRITIADGHQ